MNKTKFTQELIKKYHENLSYSVISEENQKIYLFYFENKHVATWVNKKTSYIFENPKNCF